MYVMYDVSLRLGAEAADQVGGGLGGRSGRGGRQRVAGVASI